jgi:hypothetical protein
MGKKYRGRMCVYCGKETATTDDHVFPRQFFLKADRADLPKAPACDRCNNKKSGFETYLTTVLPFGGRHPQAVASAEQVPRRLAKHPNLAKTLLVLNCVS